MVRGVLEVRVVLEVLGRFWRFRRFGGNLSNP